MRLPNGFGNVSKLSGKRRRPWRARKTIGWEYRDKEGKAIEDPSDLSTVKLHQLYEIVGYFETRADAISALSTYSSEDKTAKTITFAEVYSLWSEKRFEKIAVQSTSAWKTAYKKCQLIHNIPICEIRLSQLELCISKYKTQHGKSRLRQLFINVFKYAENHSFIEKNYAKMLDPITVSLESDIHQPFLYNEIQALKQSDTSISDVIIFGIYTGFRPAEIIEMKKENIDLENGIVKNAGKKTKSGKARIVPLHPEVIPIVKKYMRLDKYTLFGFSSSYVYRKAFSKEMKSLGLSHLPYDTRHSFITYAKESGFNEYILKQIVGHSTQDITEKVYTHRFIESIKNEMLKFNIVSYVCHT